MHIVGVQPEREDIVAMHVAALLFPIIKYIQLDVNAIQDDLTCTQLLQQWHVPSNDELNEPILYEDVVFEQASYEKKIENF